MFWIKKKDHLETFSSDHDKRERLFFHDIINQTHGLILFLNQRQSTKQVIEVDEIEMLEKEVRTLQSLIKDHFQFKHKNLPLSYDWVPFSIGEMAVRSLIETYFPKNSLKAIISSDFKGNEEAIIYFPVFYRIMNNLIKNMAEALILEVHIEFKGTIDGLTIETKNQCMSTQGFKILSDKLPQLILEESPKEKSLGLGLESIHYLALECGGTFDFEIVNNYWINRIFLPAPASAKKAA